jgi:hypothetical protein
MCIHFHFNSIISNELLRHNLDQVLIRRAGSAHHEATVARAADTMNPSTTLPDVLQ